MASDLAADVRAWLAEAWDRDLSLFEWRDRLVDGRWARPSWPAAWFGRDLPPWADAAVEAELAAVGAPGLAPGVGVGLAAPTILAHGPDAVRHRLLRRTLTGEITWCQLFSEPGSGSDLAGLTTRAVGDGEQWLITGQKVWNTSAHHADLGLLLARTDWDAPKHSGITCFALDMRQSGVEVRPLRQMNGYASFNEVFLTDAVVTAGDVIGELHAGWSVALTTLAHERRLGGFDVRRPSGEGRACQEAAAEAARYLTTYAWYPQRAGRPDLLVEQARAMGQASDALARDALAAAHAFQQAAAWTARRAHAARAGGHPPGPEGSLAKLSASRIARQSAALHGRLAGATAMLAGDDAPLRGVIGEVLTSVPAVSIAGGTDEIQHNIIGERVLGLPREPSVDRDVPFREVRRNS
jgi:alkylation response protein AidB-like acyl-CoA dehydrogenase